MTPRDLQNNKNKTVKSRKTHKLTRVVVSCLTVVIKSQPTQHEQEQLKYKQFLENKGEISQFKTRTQEELMMTYVANFFHQLKFVGDRCQFEFVTN